MWRVGSERRPDCRTPRRACVADCARMVRPRVIAVGALACALATTTVSAQQTPSRRVRLLATRGVGAERCPDAEQLRESVRGRLSYDPFVEPSASRFELTFVRHGRWLVAELRADAEDGAGTAPRTLRTRPTDCDALGASAALALSLAIESLPESPPLPAPPTLVTEPAIPATPPPPTLPATPTPAPTAAPTPRPPPAARVERGWEINADALLGIGLAPELSFGARVTADYRFGPGRVTAGLMALAPATLRATNGSVRVSTYLATAGACLGVSFASACLVFAGGVMRAEGFDVGVAHEAVTPFFLAGLRATLETPRLGPLRARLTGELLAPMTPTAHLIDRQTVWETPAVAATVGLGLGVILP